MSIEEVLTKYGVPNDAVGTCAIQDLKKKHVSYVARSKYLKLIEPNKAAYILIEPQFFDEVKMIPGNEYIKIENATQAFLHIHNLFNKDVPSFTTGDGTPSLGVDCKIDPTARFGDNVVLGDRVQIHPHVVVGSNVDIGDDTIIMASAAIYDRTRIGKRCIIDANCSIGGDGFRIIHDSQGNVQRLIHTGGVWIGDDVEFGNSSCIDRGSFGNTILENRVKVDNMVHIGHNAVIKENTQLAASSCIGGSAKIGKNCFVGIGATLLNGLTVGNNAKVNINAIVTRDVPDNETVAGFYAMPNDVWRLVIKDRAKRFDMK